MLKYNMRFAIFGIQNRTGNLKLFAQIYKYSYIFAIARQKILSKMAQSNNGCTKSAPLAKFFIKL